MKKSLLVLSLASAFPAWAQTLADVDIAPLPSAAEKQSRSYQPWLNQVNLPYANQLGMSNGSGVVDGIADTGVDAAHVELRGQVVKSYDVFDGSADASDSVGHGTHVAGLLAGTTANGAPFQGVAMGAGLAIAKVFDATGTSSTENTDQGINWLVNTARVPIISLSIGGTTAGNAAAIRNGVANGVLFAIAAGNDGNASVSWPAHFASQAWANNQIIVVGAVDANNKLAPFSNHGADTAAWFVVAPGVNLLSSFGNGGYAALSGTSMAAPIVAGQAALIKSNWRFLAASQISQIIFKTATRLGSATDARPDPVYGWGLIDIGRSLSPVGNLLATAGNTTVALAGAGMVAGTGVFRTRSLSMMGLDSFGRGFSVDLGKNMQATTAQGSTSAILYATAERQSALIERVGDGQSVSYLPNGRALALTQNMSHGMLLGFGSGAMSGRFFGLEASGLAPFSLVGDGKFNAPYFAMVKDASHAGLSLALDRDTRLRVGVLAEAADARALAGPAFSEHRKRSLLSAEFEHRAGPAVAIVSIGMLQESGSLLGSQQGLGLALNATPKTAFATLSAGYALSPTSALVAMASSGRSAGFANADSLVSQVSPVSTVAGSVGLSASQLWSRQDRFGLSVSVPPKVTSGAMSLTGAVAQRADGSLSYATQTLNLRPTATERDLELTYASGFGKAGKLSSVMMWRQNPGHDASAALDRLLGLRYSVVF